MKRILAAALLVTACSTATTTTTRPPAGTAQVSGPGGSTPQLAVQRFLNAVRANDLQTMGQVFGTSRGPSSNNMDRNELERRLVIIQSCFNHDKFRILGEHAGEGAHRVVQTELTRGNRTRRPRMYTIRGAGGRWFVDNMEIAVVNDFCGR